MKFQELGKGKVLFNKGDPADAFYIIIGGEIELHDEFRGEKKYLSLLRMGQSLGERGILKKETRKLTAQAKQNA